MFRWADCVICNSHAAAKRLVQQGLPADKIAVIWNGLPAAAFARATPIVPPRAGCCRVGMIARMNTHSKNHAFLLQTAARLRTRVQNFELVLVGDGPASQTVGISRGTIADQGVRAIPRKPRRRPAVLASLDVTVLPSSSESLSNAILESMAAGVPVIATDVGGNAELVADGRGSLVSLGDESAFENALETMINDVPFRERQGESAAKFAKENFTIERMRREHEELYRELLDRKQAKGRPVCGAHGKSCRRLRVAIVAASSRYVGGHSVQAELLSRHWRNDPDVAAEVIAIDPALPGVLRLAELVPGLRTIVREPIYMWHLWRGLGKTDVAHIFAASYWSFLLAPVPAWLLARLRKRKVILHYHSGEARGQLERFPMASRMLRRMDALIVPSEYLVRVFSEFGLAAKAVPNIVDLSDFNFKIRSPLRPHLLCTRGFHPYYRIDLVVRAFEEVQKVFPEARLDLAGGGPLEKEIRSLVEKLHLTGVRFLGVVTRGEIGTVYDSADIFVNASFLDNMPVSVLEAFASGTPVVSTAPEGMEFVIENERTGLLSPAGDACALAQNILRLLSDQEFSERLATNAYEGCTGYQWAAIRQMWLEIYRGTMGEHGNARRA